MGDFIKDAADWAASPTRYFFGSALAIVLVQWWRKLFTKPIFIIGFFVLGTAFLVFAWDDPNFNLIITKPDNVRSSS